MNRCLYGALLGLVALLVVVSVTSCERPSTPIEKDPVVKITVERSELEASVHKRGEMIVCAEYYSSDANESKPNIRMYYVEGHYVGLEEDVDGDLFFERLILFRSEKASGLWDMDCDFEMFIRSKDGGLLVGDSSQRREFVERTSDELRRLVKRAQLIEESEGD